MGSLQEIQEGKSERMQRAYSSHFNNLVSDDQTGSPKKLYSFIKSKKCDASGVAPFTSNGVNYSDSVKKANTLCLHRIGP